MPFLSGTSLDLNMDGLHLTKSEEQDWATYWRSYKSTYNSKYHYPIKLTKIIVIIIISASITSANFQIYFNQLVYSKSV